MDLAGFLKKNGLIEGDRISVRRNGSDFVGTVIPSVDPKILALKLDSGYNAGLAVSDLSDAKKLGVGKKVSKPPVVSLKKDPALPTILILHTGGTIASRVDYRTGAVFTSFEPEDLLTLFPELGKVANFRTRLLAQMWSEDMRFAHYTFIAKEIEKEIRQNPDLAGIIIAHGTDTLGYSSAALAFAVSNLPFPVVLVGSQRSSDRGSSDAHGNLLAAAKFIAKSDFAGIAVCMHESENDDWCSILPPCKTRKLHTSRRDAFRAVNDSPIGRVNIQSGEIQFVKKDFLRREKRVPLVRPAFAEKVGLVKLHTNFCAEQLEPFLHYDGLVIEGMALGQAPISASNEMAKPNLKNREMIEKIISNGCIVVMASQCVFGRVQMHVYDKAVDLANMGVISGEDMLSETAFVKLAWLLANFKDKSEVKRLMQANLAGEISAFSSIESHL